MEKETSVEHRHLTPLSISEAAEFVGQFKDWLQQQAKSYLKRQGEDLMLADDLFQDAWTMLVDQLITTGIPSNELTSAGYITQARRVKIHRRFQDILDAEVGLSGISSARLKQSRELGQSDVIMTIFFKKLEVELPEVPLTATMTADLRLFFESDHNRWEIVQKLRSIFSEDFWRRANHLLRSSERQAKRINDLRLALDVLSLERDESQIDAMQAEVSPEENAEAQLIYAHFMRLLASKTEAAQSAVTRYLDNPESTVGEISKETGFGTNSIYRIIHDIGGILKVIYRS